MEFVCIPHDFERTNAQAQDSRSSLPPLQTLLLLLLVLPLGQRLASLGQ